MGGRRGTPLTRRHALHDLQLAFIGAGAMGEAMIGGLLSRHELDPINVTASDRHGGRLDELQSRHGIHVTLDNHTAARKGRVVILAVKPQVLLPVFDDLRGHLRKDALVLSIVAGATIDSLAAGLNHQAIVRTMPNTPAQIGEGMTVWTATPEVTESQREQARAVVEALGRQLYVDDERLLDVATAISGSGPSYVFLMMEAMMDAAVHLGLSRADSRKLVIQTIRGSAMFAERSSVHPAEMRNLVTSPGGTSADALYQLEKGALRTVVSKAVLAAYQRSVELGQMNRERLESSRQPASRPKKKRRSSPR